MQGFSVTKIRQQIEQEAISLVVYIEIGIKYPLKSTLPPLKKGYILNGQLYITLQKHLFLFELLAVIIIEIALILIRKPTVTVASILIAL